MQGHGQGVYGPDGVVEHVDGVLYDVTARRSGEERLAHLALHDPLTDLPNRALFQEHLTVAIANAARTGFGGAVLFIDLDDFKLVNDTFGHAVGDELLVIVARRLRESCRAGDVVARQGGDEFLVLVQGTDTCETSPEAAAQTVAANLRAALAKPFPLAGTDLYVTSSIGASLFPTDGDTAETLLKHADIAMYAAKDGGRDGYRLYQPPKRDSSVPLALAYAAADGRAARRARALLPADRRPRPVVHRRRRGADPLEPPRGRPAPARARSCPPPSAPA